MDIGKHEPEGADEQQEQPQPPPSAEEDTSTGDAPMETDAAVAAAATEGNTENPSPVEAAAPAAPDQASASPSPSPPPPAPAKVGGSTLSGSASTDQDKPPKKGRGCLIAVIVVCVLCLILIALGGVALSSLAAAIPSAENLAGTGDGRIREEVIAGAKAGSGKKIAVIDIKGMIVSEATFEGAGTRTVCKQLKMARQDKSVVAVILDMNTPGGGVTASDEIYRAVRKVSAQGKPVVTCMHAVGASGGYMVAAGSDYIIANRLTLTGSIGVIVGTINYAGLFERFGLESEIYKSGELKDLLHGGRKRTEAEKALVEQLVTENFREFAQIVADGRDRFASVQDVLNAEFADGRVLTGRQALEAGLVDELGYLDDAVDKAKKLAGAPGAKVVRYRRSLRLSDVLFAVRSKEISGLRSILPLEARLVKPGRLYYLLPSVLP